MASTPWAIGVLLFVPKPMYNAGQDKESIIELLEKVQYSKAG